MRELKSKVFESGSCKIIDGYSTPDEATQQIHRELERMFKIVSDGKFLMEYQALHSDTKSKTDFKALE